MMADERKNNESLETRAGAAASTGADREPASRQEGLEEAAAPEGRATVEASTGDEGPFAHSSAAEAELARHLEGPIETGDPQEEAVARLSPRWEIRVQAEFDPVAVETALYRKMAKEADGRYDDGARESRRRS